MKSSKNNIATPLIILVILFLLIGWGVYYSRSTNNNSSTPIPGDISDWKTYTNEQLGFKFKYPPDWNYRTVTDTSTNSSIQLFSPETYALIQKGDKDFLNNFMTLDVSNDKPQLPKFEGRTTDISGQTAVDTTWRADDLGSYVRKVRIFAQPTVTIDMYADLDTQQIEDEILATFTLTKIPAKPFITLKYPNGGERFVVGSDISLIWTSKDIQPQDDIVLSLYNVDNPGISKFRIKTVKNSGSANLHIDSGLVPGKYRVIIEDYMGDPGSMPYGDQSDSDFIIVAK